MQNGDFKQKMIQNNPFLLFVTFIMLSLKKQSDKIEKNAIFFYSKIHMLIHTGDPPLIWPAV